MAKVLLIVALIALIAVSGVAAKHSTQKKQIVLPSVSEVNNEECPLCTSLMAYSHTL